VLSRDIASLGIYPAVDPLIPPRARSIRSHRQTTTTTRAVQATPQRYKVRDIIAIWAWTSFAKDKLAVSRADPEIPLATLTVAQNFTGAGQVRLAQGHHQGLQDDRRRRVRRPPTGVLHGRCNRRSLRESEPCSNGAAMAAATIHVDAVSAGDLLRRGEFVVLPGEMGESGISRATPAHHPIKRHGASQIWRRRGVVAV
jgi:hypothetical protein